MTNNYDRAVDHIRSIWPEAVNVEDSAEQLIAELRRSKKSFRSLTRDDFLAVLTFHSPDDRANVEIPHEGNEEESCLLPPKRLPKGSHADCDHPATKAARAKCRTERHAAMFTKLDYLALSKKERRFADDLAADLDPESITKEMVETLMP